MLVGRSASAGTRFYVILHAKSSYMLNLPKFIWEPHSALMEMCLSVSHVMPSRVWDSGPNPSPGDSGFLPKTKSSIDFFCSLIRPGVVHLDLCVVGDDQLLGSRRNSTVVKNPFFLSTEYRVLWSLLGYGCATTMI